MDGTRILAARSFPMREEFKLPLFYSLLLGAFAAWQSLFNVHLDGIGFSSMQIGILNGIFVSTSAVVVPFWGMFADKYGGNRILLLLTGVCAVLVFLIGNTYSFTWMVLFISLISVFHQPAGAVVDGLNVGFVKENPKFSFGQFRLWSSVGYASLSLIVGYLARQGTSVIFRVSTGMFLLIFLVNLFTLPANPVKRRSMVNFRSFGIFFRNRQMFAFLLLMMFFGISVSPLMSFINLYYKDIGASSSFIGWVLFVQAVPEIPAYIVGTRIVKRIGAERTILIAMGVSFLRMVLYGLTRDPDVAIMFSIFHCITIAFFLLGVVEYVQFRTPAHLRTTGQALIWAFHYGAGVSLGNILLGYLRGTVGMLSAMHIHALLALLIFVLTVLFFKFLNEKAD
jgi:PPP family 3-phenylpropionic acid transporter